MIKITLILLILINLYGFVYSLLITKYNYSSNSKIQQKKIDYSTLKKRLPLILFNISVLMLFNYIGIRYFDYIFLKDYNSIIICLFEVLFVLIIDDFFFYVLHRGMHESKYIYKKIHKIHHRANVPIPFEYIYVHPLEWMSGMIGPFLGMCFIGGIAFQSYCIYLIVRNVHEIHIHSGIKTSVIFNILPFYGNNEHHDIHHAKRYGNYASTFTVWDFLFNTKLENN